MWLKGCLFHESPPGSLLPSSRQQRLFLSWVPNLSCVTFGASSSATRMQFFVSVFSYWHVIPVHCRALRNYRFFFNKVKIMQFCYAEHSLLYCTGSVLRLTACWRQGLPLCCGWIVTWLHLAVKEAGKYSLCPWRKKINLLRKSQPSSATEYPP